MKSETVLQNCPLMKSVLTVKLHRRVYCEQSTGSAFRTDLWDERENMAITNGEVVAHELCEKEDGWCTVIKPVL
jgi:hypothetical protein